ncbi:hypothetical protein ABNM12_15130 [Pseudomonas syringae]|uniref:Lipoprotein n=4 Tax=Pseudomonas syringae group TaxID=136849 RepID=A0A3M5WR40_9PSED|nr:MULTISPECIES: hypothetical protein [Pseudomonas syringae group]AAY39516.1 hypothetical protein Psyr_4486 [Pseudomonas syringae pv. syringae B728a]AVB27813.1 hypothetical protein BKC06_023385 [Pseudomonas syringae pv. syringae]EGH69831.1 hypothetical protein PSYAR_04653 [Pseudomonas syringae pv. aceris str. M302273]KOG05479.1 Uncharacterized protein Precursor [Pseudomonas syringae pv. aceris]KPB21709.1 Uncharacterized protein Precursor [Pseudomonas syringae pv. syringae]
MKRLKTLGLAAMLVLSGCASFTKDEVAPVTMPSMASYTNKPNVFVAFDFYQGTPGTAGAVEVPQARDALKPQLQKALTDSGLFGRVTLDEFKKQPGDYSLHLKVYNHPPSGGQMVMAFVSGLTLTIIPSMATDQYSMSLDAQDSQGKVLRTVGNHDAINTWIGIWFVPMMANTPQKAVTDTFTRQVNSLLKQLVDSQSLKYSMLNVSVPQA